MTYKELNVNYEKPDVWRRSSKERIPKVGRPYLDYAKEILAFDKLKEEAKTEICGAINRALDTATTKNELNMNLDGAMDFYSKAMIPTDDFEPEFLLKKTNQNTLAKKLQPWCKNLAYNIPEVIASKPFKKLEDKFKGIPAFVCLAGPSLKNNREKLIGLKGKAIIIAVDTSLRPLLDIGVVPDICVTHDANPNGLKFFVSKEHEANKLDINFNAMSDEQLAMVYAELKNDTKRLEYKYDTVGLFVDYCHPLTLLAWNGLAKAFYAVLDPALPVYDVMAGATNYRIDGDKLAKEDKGRVVGGSSVGHVATYIAVQLGCKPISFLGLDLSYPGGKTYVEGASNQKDMRKQKLIEMEDLSGNKVPTNLSMLSYKMVFERSLPAITINNKARFYNCTSDALGHPAGILEEGAFPRSLQSVIDEYCKETRNIDILKVLNE